MAQQCRSLLRMVDVLGRYGGEEFVILLPDTTLPQAEQVAERLRQHLEARPVVTSGAHVAVTISLGVATFDAGHSLGLDMLLSHADQALYRAKQTGRNRVVRWEPTLDACFYPSR